MKKAIKILALLTVFSLIPIIILILFSPYFLAAYKGEISRYLGEALHRKVEIKKISLSVMNGLGLSVEDIKVHNEPGFKNDLFLKIESFNLSMEFWPLLRQKIESRGITFHNPQLFLETNGKGVSNLDALGQSERKSSQPQDSPSGPEFFPGIRISKLHIINGLISNENAVSHNSTALTGIEINLPKVSYSPENGQTTLLQGVRVNGEINVSHGKINQFSFENLKGEISLERMNLLLKNWTLNSYGGTVSGNLDLKLAEKNPRYLFNGKAEKLNLQTLLNQNISSQNLMEGSFNTNVSLEGTGLEKLDIEKNLSGKGTFLLHNGVLKSVNILKQISLLSSLPTLQHNGSINETRIDSLKGDLVISHGKLFFQSLKGTTPEGEVMGEGNIDFHEMVDFRLKLILNKSETDRLPREVKPFLADDNNQASFPVTLQGNISSPSVRLTGSAIKKKVIEKGLEQGVRSLIDRFSPK
jgi:uncharacterized protein involved in outer membrane biogenesis